MQYSFGNDNGYPSTKHGSWWFGVGKINDAEDYCQWRNKQLLNIEHNRYLIIFGKFRLESQTFQSPDVQFEVTINDTHY